VYGHVETWHGTTDTEIKIERLGTQPGAPYVDGVDIIWTATCPEPPQG
jgi:hypothetical protein